MPQPDPILTFIQEADDLLVQIEEVALGLDKRDADPEAINQLFRAFHTLKGSGAMFGFDELAAFTHHVESTLDRVREGALAFTPELLDCILAAKDQIKALLDAGRGGAPHPREAAAAVEARFRALADHREPAAPAIVNPPVASDEGESLEWTIKFYPAPGMVVAGTDPLGLLRELGELGRADITALVDRVPPLDQLVPEECRMGWRIHLATTRGLNAIKDVFIFVEEGAELTITPASADAAVSVAPDAERKPDPLPNDNASAAPERPAARARSVEATVRVPADRLDRLVSLVGELVVNDSRLRQVAERLNVSELDAPVEEIERLIGELRERVLGLRMMPIGSTFSRFKRLVHDLSAELGKEIELVTEGAATELDKTMLERLGDPLVHLIRNSIDHGIEPGDVRERAGKPRSGTIRLSAVHRGSTVVITIEDDGRGLDQVAIRRKAVERGLIGTDANLSERDVFNLIFQPGFSTASSVTSVSGRGVGMDVVKRQLESLRGGVDISSTRGAGTRISLTLPLTLAIVDGLLVELNADKFVIPTSAVLEAVELTLDERAAFNGRQVISVRGDLIPCVRLRELFDVAGQGPVVERVVIVQHGVDRIGIVVDRVLGSHQTVIQPLGRFCRHIHVLSGATIMGDGSVALILDIGGLVRLVETTPKPLLGAA